MALLTDEDYEALRNSGIEFAEDEVSRFVIFLRISLPEGLYNTPHVDVLVMIPRNYPDAGNDMFWTSPRLHLVSGVAIPATTNPGGSDNRQSDGREFCRWSRHWNPGTPGIWRAGSDDILSIYRRVQWALDKPMCE